MMVSQHHLDALEAKLREEFEYELSRMEDRIEELEGKLVELQG